MYLALQAALGMLFARTLLPGREPLVTRLARAVHGELPAPIARYTRAVTLAWTVFFAFQMMVAVDNMEVMGILSDATNTIAEGEVQQLLNCHDPDIDEENYLRVIRYKTAKLFEAAGRLGAVLGGGSDVEKDALARYDMHLGTAFQRIDDVLDYSGDFLKTGKNIGDDLAEGKPTLPLLYAR